MVPEKNRRYERVLSLLNKISSTILEQEKYENLLDDIIDRVVESFDAWEGCVAVADSDEQWFRFVAGFTNHPQILERLNNSEKQRLDEGVIGSGYTTREICAMEDINEQNQFAEKYCRGVIEKDIQAIVAVPLIVFDECLGVLTLYFTQKTEFDDAFFRIMNLVADQIAIAIQQSNLIEKLQQSNRRLKKLAETDGLTGLPNHRTIQGTLRHELKRSNRYNHSLSLIMADIDDFKKINDSYGHAFGDRVLKELSNIFQNEIRSVDQVGRYGGEEFLFVLPETGEDHAYQVAERIRQTVETSSYQFGETNVGVTISAGISSDYGGSIEPDKLLKQADWALLKAKRTGRNQTISNSEFTTQNSFPTAS